jgi:tRNA A-37 threonylcarbamoyl transferase component Bud32
MNSRLNQTYRNQTLNTSYSNKNKINDSSLKQSFNISIDKTKVKNKRKKNYLKTELTSYRNDEKEIQKNYVPKSGTITFNYLKYTISAMNKIVKKREKEKEKENHNKTNDKSILSRPFSDKKTKSINRKETKNKLKTTLILRNTISRYKLFKKKNLFLDDEIIRESIKSPNLTKRYSTLYNSTKNFFNKIDNYKMLKSLGKGSYGEVKLAVEKLTGIKYAIKIYSKKVFDDPKKKKNIENEIKILKQLDNINIMKLHEVIKTDKFNYLIMEYIDGISLLEIIKNEKKHYLEEKRALKIFIQIVKAIEYCQSKNICHRDIKLENILTLKNDIIKLIDFGFAVKTNKETFQTLLCGSPSYMAPEIVKKEKYIAQYSDIWSLGVLLYSMLFGRFPFKGKTQKELFESIKKCEVEFPEEIKVSDEIKLLFKKIFVDIPAQRPSPNEILNEINLIAD